MTLGKLHPQEKMIKMTNPAKTPKNIQSQETKPNGVAINNMSKAPKSEVALQLVREKGKTPDTQTKTDEEILKEDTGSEIAKIIYRNSKVREEMMKWKKMDIIDFFIEKEDEHKKAIALTREEVANEINSNYPSQVFCEQCKKLTKHKNGVCQRCN